MPIKTPDITFFHPPAIYDFRERPEFFGPISDVIPSSPVFEMYPVGLTSIADHLERNGYDVQLVNLAHEMLQSRSYDPEREIERCPAWVVGIDLHWLPHAHGCIEVAKLVKEHHPDVPVVLGGMAASYYHDELVEYPCVDYVVRGDATREPMLQLVRAIDGEGKRADVPNLTWRRNGETVANPITYVPESLDYASIPAYTYVIRSVMKYGSLQQVLPYRGWLNEPVTMLLTSHGCVYDCSFCGGARSAYRDVLDRDAPAFRSPEMLAEDVRTITSFSEGPIFVVNDIRMGGTDYAHRFLDLLDGSPVDNEFIFELFRPADADFFRRIDDAVSAYSMEMSIESHDREIRAQVGKFDVPNRAIEATLRRAFANGCRSFDVFFMIGLPKQTYDDVMASIEYCADLLAAFPEETLKPFIAPLAPFLDPGSPAYENPDEYGYTLFCETFEDHRQQLLEPSWGRMLSYETEWMTREEIVDATYEAARRLNEVKHEHDVIDRETYEQVRERIDRSYEVLEEIEEIYDLPPEQQDERLRELNERVEAYGEYSICGGDELSWRNNGLRSLPRLGLAALRSVWGNVEHRLRPS